MVYVEVTENTPGAKPRALGAAVAPEKIAPSIPAPADFDAFWAAKIKALRKVPAKPELTEKPSEKDGVDFAILKMNHLEGKHVWGQVAKPHDSTNKKKYPGPLILQWASPPYPLQKSWVTDRAAEGWLTREHRAARRDARSAQGVLRRAARGAQELQHHRDAQPRQELLPYICTWPTSARSTTSPAARTGTARRWWSWARAWAASKACAPRACIRKSPPCSSMCPPAPTPTATRMAARSAIRSGT